MNSKPNSECSTQRDARAKCMIYQYRGVNHNNKRIAYVIQISIYVYIQRRLTDS